MQYVVLFHANPQPWTHPVGAHTEECRKLPGNAQRKLETASDALLTELTAQGELQEDGSIPLGDPQSARIARWTEGGVQLTTEPYANGEHLAGLFLIDVESAERAEEILERFAGPGETVELRPVVSL